MGKLLLLQGPQAGLLLRMLDRSGRKRGRGVHPAVQSRPGLLVLGLPLPAALAALGLQVCSALVHASGISCGRLSGGELVAAVRALSTKHLLRAPGSGHQPEVMR